MCIATGTLAAISIGTSLAGTAVSAYGAMQQGKAASEAAAYNAQVAENNRIIADQNAEYAVRAGISKAEQESLRGRAAMGEIKAAQAASAINTTLGSAVDVQTGAREANVLDVANVIQNAQLEAYGYRSEAANFGAEAGLARMEGKAAKSAGNISALGTLLSGAGAVSGKYGEYKKAEVWA